VEAGDRDSEALLEPGLDRELQREVELAAERGQHGEAHLAGRVAETLDQHRPIVGDRTGLAVLACHEIAEGPRARSVEPAFGPQPVEDARIVDPIGYLSAQDADGLA